jgi:hypothetical protein
MSDLDIIIVASSAVAIAAIAVSLYARWLRKAFGRDDIKPDEFGC